MTLAEANDMRIITKSFMDPPFASPDEPQGVLLAQPRVDHPKVGSVREDPKGDQTDGKSLNAISAGQPDHRGVGYTRKVFVNLLLRGVVADEVAEVEGVDALDGDLHRTLSPTTISGTTPSTLAGTGSLTWNQYCPSTSYSGSTTMRSSPDTKGICWPSTIC